MIVALLERLQEFNDEGSTAFAEKLLRDPSVMEAIGSIVYRAALDNGKGPDVAQAMADDFVASAARGNDTDRGAATVGMLRTVLQVFTGMDV